MLKYYSSDNYAGVVELADARDSKSRVRKNVRVRPPPPAPKSTGFYLSIFLFDYTKFNFAKFATNCEKLLTSRFLYVKIL